jgi:hypothetical protein
VVKGGAVMTGFYISIMFIGVLLITFSIVWIAFDKKKGTDEEKKITEKREDLLRIIKDAEIMVDELNKFSDYIISQVDTKNKEVYDVLAEVEGKIESIKKESMHCSMDEVKVSKKVVNGSIIDTDEKEDLPLVWSNESKFTEKIIPINSRHKEVIKLAQSGLNETEIAKKLNMGKGEIKLILGVNKQI